MPTDRPSQTIRRRRLAVELRRLRERADLTGDQAAERLGWSGSKISRIETHRIGVKPADLRKLLDLYGIDAPHREELQALAQESTRTSPLDSVVAGLPADYAEYLQAEVEARSIWNWDPLIIPGLLQTEAYSRAVHLGYQSMFRLPPKDTERRIQLRQTRQKLLTRDPPLELSVVIDESVLRRKLGDRTVMRAQLLHLAEVSSMPNVEIRVLRLEGAHPVGTGAFSYMQFPQVHDVPLRDMVTVEHLTGSYYLEDEEHTFRYHVMFDSLRQEAIDEGQSRDLILDTARQTWS